MAYGLSLVGECVGYSILKYIRIRNNLPQEVLLQDPALLADGLEETLGSWSYIVERRIISSLYSQVGIDDVSTESKIKPGHYGDFERAVEELKLSYMLSGQMTQERRWNIEGGNLKPVDALTLKVYYNPPSTSSSFS